MSTRGSLTQCIAAMRSLFNIQRYQLLSIVHNPAGKYYTLLTEDELLKYQRRHIADRVRLVCTISAKELCAFSRTNQQTLNLD